MVKRVHVRLAALWSHCGHGLDPLLMNRSGVENLAEFGRKFLTRSRDSWQERSGHKQAQGSQTEPFRRGRGADVKMSRVQEEVRSWKKEGKPSII